ncbi:hypothetical protein GA0116948_109148 [Chitinophaga costaii]|uniref:Circularly permuted ATP-grasp type 2 n=1 Tax=Chitinophaga costaii TaxID=1335309 RepID=A0A1C4ERM8_9BACT|nr:hypothetical protein [Chitinophaga costaii]PUZ22549.1 hypothetical protein DCM91_14880 [Chitinophaga costaii]SCC46288.1 hypothetical protein GA0116948_109148 [Chitinophaga costaii]
MIPPYRTAYNAQFTAAKYAAFLADIAAEGRTTPPFRVAETPVFIPTILREKMLDAANHIIDVILQPDFKERTEAAIPADLRVANENDHAHCVIIDFAVCQNQQGMLEPQLIELQGFPSLFAFQELLGRQFRRHFDIPASTDNFPAGWDQRRYYDFLQHTFLAGHAPEHVILLEVQPLQQKTLVDFYATENQLGIRPVCVSDLIQEGRSLFYLRDGVKTQVKRIYNRVIFEDLEKQKFNLGHIPDLFGPLDVTWAPHPNWFYRISKYTLPLLYHTYIPESRFLHTVTTLPTDLENYVLKPLFSYAGQGVIINVTPAHIASIENPTQWILQRKVEYAPAVETPTGPAKCEVRLMYAWPDADPRPTLVHSLVRLSKSAMIGVNFNAQDNWVGGSAGFFER